MPIQSSEIQKAIGLIPKSNAPLIPRIPTLQEKASTVFFKGAGGGGGKVTHADKGQEIIVSGGQVKIGTTTYSGTAEVPGVGKTASALSKETIANLIGQKDSTGNLITSKTASNYSVKFNLQQPTPISEPKLIPITAKISGHEQVLGSMSKYYSPFSTDKETITGFVDLRTKQSIPLQNLNSQQLQELQKEGWKFNSSGQILEVLGVTKPSMISKEQYKEQFPKAIIPKETFLSNAIENVKKEYNSVNDNLRYMLFLKPITLTVTKGMDIITYSPFPSLQKSSAEQFLSGAVKEAFEDIERDPLKNIGLFAAGMGLGVAFKGVATGLTAIPKVGGALTTGFKVSAIGYGAYQTGKTAIDVGIQAMDAKNSEEAGRIVGATIKDIALIGAGVYAGEKGFDIIKGEIRTRGLQKLEGVKQGVYPSAPVEKQLELFQKNIFKQVSEKPVSFHVTSEYSLLIKDMKVIPQVGRSELPGLYTSTQISTPFSRIAGSGAETPKQFSQFIKSLQLMFGPEHSPGVAILEPKGFREVRIGYSAIQQFEGQKYVKGRGYAVYLESTKPGFIDIPKMKTEIEGIARVGAGEYELTGKKFYTEISGVKVRMDHVKYIEDGLKAMQDTISKVANKKFLPDKYYPYVPPTTSEALLLSGLIRTSRPSSARRIISSRVSSVSYSGRSVSTQSSMIQSEISRISSGISRSISKSVSPSAPPSSAPSQSSVPSSAKTSRASTSSAIKIPYPIVDITLPKRMIPQEQKRSLGKGFNVFGKQLKSNKLFRINHQPLTKSRAKDIGSFYVSQTLARTFVIKPSSGQAQPDYEFGYVPEGFFSMKSATLRPYRIKRGKAVDMSDERFIQKAMFSLSSSEEKKQIQEFRKQASQILR